MLSLWLLPLGYFVLSRGKTKKYSTPVTTRTGLILTCTKIEIINREVAFNSIDSRIIEYCEKNKVYLENASVIEVFNFIFSKVNLRFCNKFRTKKLSQKEKMILGLFFIVVFNRMLSLLNRSLKENFISKFENSEELIIQYLIGLSEYDLENLDVIENKFRMEYSYP